MLTQRTLARWAGTGTHPHSLRQGCLVDQQAEDVTGHQKDRDGLQQKGRPQVPRPGRLPTRVQSWAADRLRHREDRPCTAHKPSHQTAHKTRVSSKRVCKLSSLQSLWQTLVIQVYLLADPTNEKPTVHGFKQRWTCCRGAFPM